MAVECVKTPMSDTLLDKALVFGLDDDVLSGGELLDRDTVDLVFSTLSCFDPAGWISARPDSNSCHSLDNEGL